MIKGKWQEVYRCKHCGALYHHQMLFLCESCGNDLSVLTLNKLVGRRTLFGWEFRKDTNYYIAFDIDP